jgi:hypothetical protein
MRKFDDTDARTVAEYEADFAQSDYGQYILEKIMVQYNELHHAAEAEDIGAEAKAFKVERAAGLKLAIDLLTANANLMDSGIFDTPQETTAP